MELPQEIEIWYIIPAIRRSLVAELKKRKLKQKDIAKILGITEAAVSQYGKDKRASSCAEVFEKEPMLSEIQASVKRLEGAKDSSSAMREISRLCKVIREKKIICDIHRNKNPGLCSCGVCYDE